MTTKPLEDVVEHLEFDQACGRCDEPAMFAVWTKHNGFEHCEATGYLCDACRSDVENAWVVFTLLRTQCGDCGLVAHGQVSDFFRWIVL